MYKMSKTGILEKKSVIKLETRGVQITGGVGVGRSVCSLIPPGHIYTIRILTVIRHTLSCSCKRKRKRDNLESRGKNTCCT